MTLNNRTLLGGSAAVLIAGLAGFNFAKLSQPSAALPPVEVKAVAPSDIVKLTPDMARNAGITVQPVVVGDIAAEVLAPATVMAAPDGEAVLTAHASGAVTRIFKRLGDPVRAGETIAIVESREAAQMAADRSMAAAKLAQAQRNLAREKVLFEQRVSPRIDYENAQAQASQTAIEARRARTAASGAGITANGGLVVVSPISGRVTSAPVRLGAFVQAETELFRVSDPARVQLEASVSASDAPRIAVGDRAIVERPDGDTVQTRVRSITPALNADTRSATVVLDPDGAMPPPGSALNVRILVKAKAAAGVVAPDESLQSVGGRDVVFVQTSAGFRAVPVRVGRRSAGRVEIVSGLKAGQEIAVSNAFLLKAELVKDEGGDH